MHKKKTVKMHIIKFDVFRSEVGVLIGDLEESAKVLKKFSSYASDLLLQEGSESVFGVTLCGHQPVYLWLRKVTPTNVAHEAVHVATSIMEYRGIPISEENDEVLAHMVEYLVQEIYKIKPCK